MLRFIWTHRDTFDTSPQVSGSPLDSLEPTHLGARIETGGRWCLRPPARLGGYGFRATPP
jgi:hypothetical protein